MPTISSLATVCRRSIEIRKITFKGKGNADVKKDKIAYESTNSTTSILPEVGVP
jgi:hypothetical protein